MELEAAAPSLVEATSAQLTTRSQVRKLDTDIAMRPASHIIRRQQRPTPMNRLRLGAAARSGHAAVLPFPGIPMPQRDGRGRRIGAGLLAGGLHLALLAGLFAAVWLTPPKEEEEPIPIELVEIKPPPPPPKPLEPVQEKVVEKLPAPPVPVPIPKPAPAPAPKALAERRSVNFEPSAQAIAPQVVNPSVIQKASPTIDAKSLDVKALQSTVSAPTEIRTASTAMTTVAAVTNVAVPTAPRAVDVGSASPAVRGPVQGALPAGTMVGPKAIAAPGSGSVGAGSVVRSGDGSSVREGAVTGRDVLGSADGDRIASVNTRVGQGNMSGTGDGNALGGDSADCDSRPEVAAYQAQVRERTKARWIAPPGIQGAVSAQLSWKLDVSGSAVSVRLVNASSNVIGNSVVEALRAAAPFPAMSDRVRCLANRTLTGTFTLTPEG